MAKREGRHPEKALTAVLVRQTGKPGKYPDGNGLYLVVDRNGAKRWLLRLTVQGKRRDIGLGSAGLVTLAEARETALTMRRSARAGGDPVAERRAMRASELTFEKAARQVHEANASTWKNAKHAAQWLSTLERYAFPEIGNRPVGAIDTSDVLRVLAPIWLTKAETARRLRQRMGTVFDWARAAGHRTGSNPIEGITRALPKQPTAINRHAAMPYNKVPEFTRDLRARSGNPIARAAFEFLILTATRTSETLGARWEEVNLDQAVWTVPAERMKAGREHRVPLTECLVGLLGEAYRMSAGSEYLFPGRTVAGPLSNMTFLHIMRRMGAAGTPHGFRSSFRDWAAETTSHPREVVEMALAHTIENKVEAAYRRGDLLEKRRNLMEDWGKHTGGA